jgi:hypothetical protein
MRCPARNYDRVATKVRARICAVPSACVKAALAGALCICFTSLAVANDDNDDDGSSNGAPKTPNIYLDMRTAYASVPAGSVPTGFSNSALVTALQSLALSRANMAVGVDLPMTIDVTDGVSLYAGVSASSTSTALTGWSVLPRLADILRVIRQVSKVPRAVIRSPRRHKTHPAHSGNPAFRSPSIVSFAFDCPPRAIHEEIVKAGSSSSRRAAASWASASRPRWAKAAARQR